MARNKHSTALFDVIHSAKKPPKGSPSASIPTPKWWGKDKKLPKPVATESSENAGRQQSWLSAARRSGSLPTTPALVAPPLAPVASDPVIEPFYTEQASVDVESQPLDTAAEIEITHISPPEPKPRFIDRFKNRAPKTEPEPSPIVEEVIAPPVAIEQPEWTDITEPEIKPQRPRDDREAIIKLDPNAGDIRFRLSYGGIIALVFILLIALAIAFIAGTRSNSTAMFLNDSSDMGAAPTTNSTSGMMAALEPTKSIDSTPVNPDVLQVAPRSSKPVTQSPTVTPPAAPLPIKATRDIGMIYVVVQSYAEPELAQRACDFMNKAGIPCSLVQGPDGWAPRDWYSVVGLQPFAKHDPGLAEYERRIKAAGVQFTTKILDQFQPQGYTWRETSDLSQQ